MIAEEQAIQSDFLIGFWAGCILTLLFTAGAFLSGSRRRF